MTARKANPSRGLIAEFEKQLRPASCQITAKCSIPWESATFSGARHLIEIVVQGVSAQRSADNFMATISDREFSISGHIVADILVTSASSAGDTVVLCIEALTVETT